MIAPATAPVVLSLFRRAFLAMRITVPALELARLAERQKCAAQLRTHADRLRSVATRQSQYVIAAATEAAADFLDPQEPLQGTRIIPRKEIDR